MFSCALDPTPPETRNSFQGSSIVVLRVGHLPLRALYLALNSYLYLVMFYKDAVSNTFFDADEELYSSMDIVM